jgi:hypothetical protein
MMRFESPPRRAERGLVGPDAHWLRLGFSPFSGGALVNHQGRLTNIKAGMAGHAPRILR